MLWPRLFSNLFPESSLSNMFRCEDSVTAGHSGLCSQFQVNFKTLQSIIGKKPSNKQVTKYQVRHSIQARDYSSHQKIV